MASNNLAPTGFAVGRNIRSAAGNYAALPYFIANGYGTNIMVGDPVSIAADGTVTAVSGTVTSPTFMLGIFAGVLPYYDTTLQATAHGLNGAYLTTIAPVSGVNVPCLVYTDPDVSFIAQVQSTTGFLPAWYGLNATWVAASINSNTAGNGRSVGMLDNVTHVIATTATYPFRIIGPAGVTGGPQDPANANPWIEVKMNATLAFMNQVTGV